jgi:hypothetical protein
VFNDYPACAAGLIHGGVPAAAGTEERHSEHHADEWRYHIFIFSIAKRLLQ